MPPDQPIAETHLERAKIHARESRNITEPVAYRLQHLSWAVDELIQHTEETTP